MDWEFIDQDGLRRRNGNHDHFILQLVDRCKRRGAAITHRSHLTVSLKQRRLLVLRNHILDQLIDVPFVSKQFHKIHHSVDVCRDRAEISAHFNINPICKLYEFLDCLFVSYRHYRSHAHRSFYF